MMQPLPSMPSCSSFRMSNRFRSGSFGARSNSKKALVDEDASSKDKPVRAFYSRSEAFALAAICSSLAALLTALLATCFVSSGGISIDQIAASTTRSVVSTRRVRYGSSFLQFGASLPTPSNTMTNPLLSIDKGAQTSFPLSHLPEPENEEGPRPQIAWLMSFPNSGTSFTLHMTRQASNCTTATNYALEGDIRDKPSVPAIDGALGDQGPFLELVRDHETTVPSTILTKTHCKGICAGGDCGPGGGIETVRSFLMGCLSGNKAVLRDGQLVSDKVTYDASLVKKAIHIFRHPLDNVVARFHLDFHDQTAAGNKKFAELYPRNADGFRKWCAADDQNPFFLQSRYTDEHMRELMEGLPCMNEFYRYVQWHNLAFETSRYLNLPTMMLHYHEYAENLETTRDRVLDWLDLPHVGPGEPFTTGKVYRHYYSLDQRKAIRVFVEDFSSVETWQQLQDYDFGLEVDIVAK